MQKHILKRIGVFSFWLVITLIIVYVKNDSKDISELLFSSIFAVFLLVLISSIFLIYESRELKKQGNFQLCKTNRIVGFSLLSVLAVLAFIFVRGAVLTF